MAVEHASELASIVASYLRKHGFAKTLSAFLRENDGTVQEMDVVDLETLYQLHISTHANEASKTKKLKKAKLEDGPGIAKGDEDVRDDAEKKAIANLYVNGGTSSEKKEKKKKQRENVAVDPPIVSEVHQNGAGKAEAKMTPKEKKDSKKKRKEVKLGKDVGTPGTVKHSVEEALSNGHAAASDCALKKGGVGNHDQDGGGLATQQEVPHFEKSPNKKSKKERKEQAGEQTPGNEAPILKETSPVAIPQVLSQEDGLSKKKRKKSKDAGGPTKEETHDIAESVSEVSISMQTEEVDATRQPVELSHDPERCETGSKKKKRRKELSSEATGDVNGSSQEQFDAKPDATKNDEGNIDSKKQSGKKRKSKEDTTPVNEISPGRTKESGEGEGVNDRNVEMQESGSAQTPNSTKTPTGALAFKRVEIEKVSFSDPRLKDNSYWAKDGAEEGYGAKAQEVLGQVRGRDFRHEKTKKKRGSYRGGLIGLQSHSIKFENSDEED